MTRRPPTINLFTLGWWNDVITTTCASLATMDEHDFTPDFTLTETPSPLMTAIEFEESDGISHWQEELLFAFRVLGFRLVHRFQILLSALPYGNIQKINSFPTKFDGGWLGYPFSNME